MELLLCHLKPLNQIEIFFYSAKLFLSMHPITSVINDMENIFLILFQIMTICLQQRRKMILCIDNDFDFLSMLQRHSRKHENLTSKYIRKQASNEDEEKIGLIKFPKNIFHCSFSGN